MFKTLRLKKSETLFFSARWKLNDTVYLLNKGTFTIKNSDNEIVLTATEASTLILDNEGWAIVTESLSDIDPGVYKYDLLVKRTTDGHTKVLLEGEIEIEDEVSVIS